MENMDTITKPATNFDKKFTHILFSCDTGELIICQHINQEPHVEILHVCRDLLPVLNFSLHNHINVPKACKKSLKG